MKEKSNSAPLARKVFDKRFKAALAGGGDRLVKVDAPTVSVEICMSSLLSNYLRQIRSAADAHAISAGELDDVEQKIKALQPLVKKLQKKAAKYLTV